MVLFKTILSRYEQISFFHSLSFSFVRADAHQTDKRAQLLSVHMYYKEMPFSGKVELIL